MFSDITVWLDLLSYYPNEETNVKKRWLDKYVRQYNLHCLNR